MGAFSTAVQQVGVSQDFGSALRDSELVFRVLAGISVWS